MNTFQRSIQYLRLVNLRTALTSLKECKTNTITPKKNLDGFPNAKAFLVFSPRSIGIEITEKQNVGRIKQDPLPYVPIVNPRSILPLVEDWNIGEIGLPSIKKDEIQAARLMVIRRKKMKKHKRRKLLKRMKYRWARIKNNRKIMKEKVFQTYLVAMVKEANEFSAEEYVANKIKTANHTPLPTRWKHKRLPAFIIRQLMGIDKKINYKHTDIYKA